MTRTRRMVLAAAALAMPAAALLATPVSADPLLDGEVPVAMSDGTGNERMCIGVDDLDRQNTTWVCTPEAQWYGEVIAMILSLKPSI